MGRFRRPLALLVSLTFLLLTAAAGELGFVCASRSSDAGHAMAEMHGAVHEPAAPSDAPPCEEPATPHGCDAMAACAPAGAVGTSAILDAPPLPEPARIAALDALAPESRTPAPESPPPRA